MKRMGEMTVGVIMEWCVSGRFSGRSSMVTADANIRFDDVRSLLVEIGFVERVKGSRHIYKLAEGAE